VVTPTLKWHGLPPYRDDPQDLVVQILRMPDYYEPTEEDDETWQCVSGDYHCVTHDQPWGHGGAHCPTHDRHEIAWVCSQHGFENIGPHQVMLWNPARFDPRLTEQQLGTLERPCRE
jgi:hypothetical protein